MAAPMDQSESPVESPSATDARSFWEGMGPEVAARAKKARLESVYVNATLHFPIEEEFSMKLIVWCRINGRRSTC